MLSTWATLTFLQSIYKKTYFPLGAPLLPFSLLYNQQTKITPEHANPYKVPIKRSRKVLTDILLISESRGSARNRSQLDQYFSEKNIKLEIPILHFK